MGIGESQQARVAQLSLLRRTSQQAGMEMMLCLSHSLSLPLPCPGLGRAWEPGT